MKSIENFLTVDHLNPATTKRLGTDMLMAGGPSYVVVHDTGKLGVRASDFVKQLKKGIIRDGLPNMAHWVVDDLEIIECVPALPGKAEQLNHVHFKEQVDTNFMGGHPNQKAIGVMYCYGGKINNDEAYKNLVKSLAYLCFVHQMEPSYCCVGHHFLDPKYHFDPARALMYNRKSFAQLKEGVVQVFAELHNIKLPKPTLNFWEIAISVRTAIRVNVRVGSPNTLAPLEKSYEPETEIYCDAWTNEGDNINGNSIWLKERGKDNFFWSGCLSKPLFDQWIRKDAGFPEQLVDWSQRCQSLDPDWIKTGGAGIRILVIDSGVDNSHPNLSHIKDERIKDYEDNDYPKDVTGHGTHCTGIINARSHFEKGIRGVAPKAEVYIYKASSPEHGVDAVSLEKALKYAQEIKPHIISMSFEGDDNDTINTLFTELFNNHVLLIAAAERTKNLFTVDLPFPANHSLCASVGTLDEDSYQEFRMKAEWEKLDKISFILPDFKMSSCYIPIEKNGKKTIFKEELGSSMATAFMCGAFALLLSSLENRLVSVPTLIQMMCDKATFLNENFQATENPFIIYKTK